MMIRRLIFASVVVLAFAVVAGSSVEAGGFRSVTRIRRGPFATRVYSRTVARPVVRPYAPAVAVPYSVSYPVTTVAPVTVGYTYTPYYYPVTTFRVAPAPIVTYEAYPVFGAYVW